jgi:hypothetical protein
MSSWDEDSDQLRSNLRQILSDLRRDALQRVEPTVAAAREWQRSSMRQLTVPRPEYVGRFRGEPGLEGCEVAVGQHRGVASVNVAGELRAFERKLQATVAILDRHIQPDQSVSADEVAAVIDLCAWAHCEWVRIHPFANGNGRTARLWANGIAMRYGLPPFVRLRPRPDGGYGAAAAAAMQGRWREMSRVFRQMYREAVGRRRRG